jgi:hypothetical protein
MTQIMTQIMTHNDHKFDQDEFEDFLRRRFWSSNSWGGPLKIAGGLT